MQSSDAEVAELGILRTDFERLDLVVRGNVCDDKLHLVGSEEASWARFRSTLAYASDFETDR